MPNTDKDDVPPGVAGHQQPRVAVGFASVGRAGILAQSIALVGSQSRVPDRILVCGSVPSDVAGISDLPGVEVMLAEKGLCKQRNAIMDAVADCDILIFLDDDFLLEATYIAATLAAFAADPAIVVTTGEVIADGAVGPGYSFAFGLAALRSAGPAGQGMVPAFNGYGCNMALRLESVRRHALRFDENLPLYAWFEDVDFTRRLGQSGRIVKLPAARGVHLGAKIGRTSGTKLGYSQVANPIYLARKGSYTWPRVVRDLGRHLAINMVKSFRPEPYVDRRGRLRGNVLAFIHLLRGILRPNRILQI